MTALTATQTNNLNKMNRAGKEANLGTRLAALINGVDTGILTISGAQASASSASIVSESLSMAGEIHNVYRSGSPIASHYVKGAILGGGVVTFTSASAGYTMTSGDVINWITF